MKGSSGSIAVFGERLLTANSSLSVRISTGNFWVKPLLLMASLKKSGFFSFHPVSCISQGVQLVLRIHLSSIQLNLYDSEIVLALEERDAL